MMTESGGILGVGYEGRTIDQLITELTSLKVTHLVDVRLNAISRKRGFSKRALADALDRAGISYRHLPQLGNPSDNRAGFAEEWHTDGGRDARSRYRGHSIENPVGQSAIDELADLSRTTRVALLCFESSELHCHRREVLAAVRDRLEQLVTT